MNAIDSPFSPYSSNETPADFLYVEAQKFVIADLGDEQPSVLQSHAQLPQAAAANQAASFSPPSTGFNSALRKAFKAHWDKKSLKRIIKMKGCTGFPYYLKAFEAIKKNWQTLGTSEISPKQMTHCSPDKLADLLNFYNSRQTDPAQEIPIPPLSAVKTSTPHQEKTENKVAKAFILYWIHRLPTKQCIQMSGCSRSSFYSYHKATEVYFNNLNALGEKEAFNQALRAYGKNGLSKPKLTTILEIYQFNVLNLTRQGET